MKTKILILGAGFGGLELATWLSEARGDLLEITLIDKSDSFVFGFSKLDLMFHRCTPDAVRIPYESILKPGLTFVQDSVVEIDPEARRVVTSRSVYAGDFLVVALGADYDFAATPGLEEGGNEFYSVPGALRISELLPNFKSGHAIVAVTSAPFKCPPAPSECALMLHDYLVERGVRNACRITLAIPFATPIPPAPEASRVLMEAFAEREIDFLPRARLTELKPRDGVAVFDDGRELPYDLLLGVPKHLSPAVVAGSTLCEEGWIPVDPSSLRTKFARVYAIGDITSVGAPKAGVFAEGAAKVAAADILSELSLGPVPAPFEGSGSCYIEFGRHQVGRVDVNFLGGPEVTSRFHGVSLEMVKDKEHFGTSRLARWFGRDAQG